jgi:protein tyrosine phosphatase (PTP) superfamily phosphohydrolase (DUF442 family)
MTKPFFCRRSRLACFVASLAMTLGCQNQQPATVDSTPIPATQTEITRIDDLPGLHNLHRIGASVYMGSEPHGEQGFANLATLGVKSIISVDGAQPNLELAQRYGMQYVHIPIGYDGVTADEGRTLARAARDCPRPVYVHCHHGQHRGPAAAAVFCVADGILQGQDALRVLQAAGTGKQYAGLWRDVENYTAPRASDELPELVAVASVGSLAAAMAQLDRHVDLLESIQQANWSVPPEHPDLVAEQEAVVVREALREAGRLLTVDFSDEFKTHMAESEAIVSELEDAIRAGRHDDATAQLVRLRQSCNRCHEKFRN